MPPRWRGLRRLLPAVVTLMLAAAASSVASAAVAAAGPPAPGPARPASAGAAGPGTPADAGAGQRLYVQGLLPSGQPLRGERGTGAAVEGAAAACATCHRRSGLGGAEGRQIVPPIIAKYLFRPAATNVQDLSMPHMRGYRATRDPYTPESLARAIREGVNPNGRELGELMPRYRIDDASMASLVAYLTGLTAGAVPGVGDEVLHFATIVAPGVDPAVRQGMLDVMQRFFDDKNAFIRGGGKPMQATRQIEYRVTRRWQLHVWDLQGAPETWEAQLRSKLAAEPVFAVLSGLSPGPWAPVHRFCEQARLPCLFPNVDQPEVAEQDFYPVYFSRGVFLEVDLIAASLMAGAAEPPRPGPPLRRVRQLYRGGDVGEAAALALAAALAPGGLAADLRALPPGRAGGPELAAALSDLAPDEALVLWLREADLQALPPLPAAAGPVRISGLLGGLERAPLAADWRALAQISYPFDLPQARAVRMNFPLTWLRINKIPLVAERVQTDTYIACGIVSETLNDMLDAFVRDYLVERVETMLDHRMSNGYYPRLSLAQGQRFASKGGYMVRFKGAAGTAVEALGDWTVP
jgi:mono/diheme cytochrome c family protein